MFYFIWLLGALGLMDAAGYPLFSGLSGIGDLGAASDGALTGVEAEWLWRAAETVAGLVAYIAVVRYAVPLGAWPLAEGQRPAPIAGRLSR